MPRRSCTVCGAAALPGVARCHRHTRAPTANQARKYRGSTAYQETRALVLRRDGYRCHLCGRSDPPADQIDHIVPYSQADPETRDIMRAEDFRAAHGSCNRRRGARALTPPPEAR